MDPLVEKFQGKFSEAVQNSTPGADVCEIETYVACKIEQFRQMFSDEELHRLAVANVLSSMDGSVGQYCRQVALNDSHRDPEVLWEALEQMLMGEIY